MLGFSESWLKSYVSNKSIALSGFNIVRNDRVGRRGGGVALYIGSDLKFNVLVSSGKTDIEYFFVEVFFGSEKYLIGVIYRPRGCLTSLDNVLSDLRAKYNNIVLMGDFNYNLLDNAKLSAMKNYWDNFGLEIRSNGGRPTHYDAQYHSLSSLDCFITSIPNMIMNYNQYWLPSVSHHAVILMSLKKIRHKSETKFSYRDYNAININNLEHLIETSHLDNIYQSNDANEQIIVLTTFLNNLFESTVPIKTVKSKRNDAPWYNHEIRRLSILRDYSLNVYIGDRCDENWKAYTRIRNRVNLLIRNEKIKYSDKFFDAKQTNKSLWQKVRQCGTHNDGSVESQAQQSKEDFCRYFASVQACKPVERTDHILPEIPNAFNFQIFTIELLEKAINSLSSNSPGTDNIDLKFLKIVMSYIKEHVLNVFNTIINSKSWPDFWKCSLVCPIPKTKNSQKCSDYRPIGLLPILSKLLELMLKWQMTDYFNENGLGSYFQSGFRANHSTTTALILFSYDIRLELDKGMC